MGDTKNLAMNAFTFIEEKIIKADASNEDKENARNAWLASAGKDGHLYKRMAEIELNDSASATYEDDNASASFPYQWVKRDLTTLATEFGSVATFKGLM